MNGLPVLGVINSARYQSSELAITIYIVLASIRNPILLFVLLTLAFLSQPSSAHAANQHEVYITNHVYISHCQKWNPKFWFGNLDDPKPPSDYRPNDRYRVREWYWRNPTHNLNFYVIGIADKNFRRAGRCPDKVFNPRGGWNWTVCKYKWLRLPFISYQKKKFGFYLGWRERGNFGAKLSFREPT